MDLKADTLDQFLADIGVGISPKAQDAFLYHYTGAEAAYKIRVGGVLCTNSQIMADEQNFKSGREILESQQCLLNYGLSWDELCANADKSVRCWIFSLCRNKDDMHMIQAYACGKSGGPTQLQFAFSDLYESVHREMEADLATWKTKKQADRRYHFLLPCLYYPSQKELIIKLEQFLFGEYLTLLMEQQSKLNYRDFAFACSHIFRAMVKADQFKDEEEYRLVKITFDGNDDKGQPLGIKYRPTLSPLPFICPLCCIKDRE